jgi:hypothetical protein
MAARALFHHVWPWTNLTGSLGYIFLQSKAQTMACGPLVFCWIL